MKDAAVAIAATSWARAAMASVLASMLAVMGTDGAFVRPKKRSRQQAQAWVLTFEVNRGQNS
jgi:hypothetical protein